MPFHINSTQNSCVELFGRILVHFFPADRTRTCQQQIDRCIESVPCRKATTAGELWNRSCVVLVAMGRLVESPLIVDCTLHRHLDRRFHPYILPFTVLYPLWYAAYLFRYETYFGSEEWTFVTIMLLISSQALMWLSGHWSIGARALTRFVKVDRRGSPETPGD